MCGTFFKSLLQIPPSTSFFKLSFPGSVFKFLFQVPYSCSLFKFLLQVPSSSSFLQLMTNRRTRNRPFWIKKGRFWLHGKSVCGISSARAGAREKWMRDERVGWGSDESEGKVISETRRQPSWTNASTQVVQSRVSIMLRPQPSRARVKEGLDPSRREPRVIECLLKRGDRFRHVREYVRRIFPHACDLRCWSFVISNLV